MKFRCNMDYYKGFPERERNFIIEHGEQYLTDVARFIRFTKNLRENPDVAAAEHLNEAEQAIVESGIPEVLEVAMSVTLDAYEKKAPVPQAESKLINHYLHSLGCPDSESAERVLRPYIDFLTKELIEKEKAGAGPTALHVRG